MAETAGASADTHQFGNIVHAGKDQHREESVGVLRMHAQGFGWKSRKTGTVISVSKADLRGIEWIKIPHAYQLKLKAKGGFTYKFNGLKNQDKGLIKSYCTANFGEGLAPADSAMSWRGWNWGEASVEGSTLSFTVEGEQAFEIPLSDVTQATAQKNETIVEMADDDTALPEDETVVELRLHMPQSMADGDDEADAEAETPAQVLVADIKANAELEQAGTALAAFEDVPVQVPRGRYDIEMFDKYMKLHGKTYDYKVLYTNVSGIFVLPKPDMYHMAVCLSLANPLRQGATTYPHVVMQLPREQQLEVTLNMTEDEVSRRFGDKVEQTEDGDMSEVVAKLVSAFAKKKVQGLKSGGFNSEKDDKSKSMRCSLKAVDGFLYPLEKCFFFISTKPVMLEFERIASIEFNRVDKSSSASAARTFDITMHMKDSSNQQFVNLQRADYQELFRFLSAKKIRIQNISTASKVNFDDDDGEDDGEDDPYMNRVKRQREEAQADDDDDSDDDSEEDADFAPGGESDVDEEYDEGDAKDEERAGKSKKGSDDSDDDSDSDEKPKKKAAPPPKKAKAAASDGKGKKKAKPKKDANAPKRNANAYMLWFNAKREEIKADNPDAATKDLAKIAGGLWKEMNPAAKAPWDEASKKDKERYLKEKAEYDAANKKTAAPAASDSDSDSES